MQLARLSKFFLGNREEVEKGRVQVRLGNKKKEKNEEGKSVVHRGNGIIIVTAVWLKEEQKRRRNKMGFRERGT